MNFVTLNLEFRFALNVTDHKWDPYRTTDFAGFFSIACGLRLRPLQNPLDSLMGRGKESTRVK